MNPQISCPQLSYPQNSCPQNSCPQLSYPQISCPQNSYPQNSCNQRESQFFLPYNSRARLYREQVCVVAEHQGSTFHYHQVAELSAAWLQSLQAQLATLRDTSNGINRAEEEAVTATAAAADDENKSVGGDEQPQGME
uniref:Uncharacterized protein n=1 Tax=Globodera rostochiensis TaxID=31243 RepID=A0A914HPX2_GLORO